MLGPAGRVTDTLIQDVCESNSGKNGAISFTAGLNGEKTIISPKLFSLKAKLIINSCTECTVLFSQMKDKDYMELNRCLWKNLLARVEQEQAISRVEMFSWIRENLNALISLVSKIRGIKSYQCLKTCNSIHILINEERVTNGFQDVIQDLIVVRI